MNTEDKFLVILISIALSMGAVVWGAAGVLVFQLSAVFGFVWFSGPIIGYLYTKPEWIKKFWKQKEYRE